MSVEIDHVLITHAGVFCIETKDYAGIIIADKNKRTWTQVLKHGEVKNPMYNPLMQNETHTYVLREMLPKGTPIIPVVCFASDHGPQIDGVVNVSLLKEFLKKHKEKVLTKAEMEEIEKILKKNEMKGLFKEERHIEDIKEQQEKIANNICPRCGEKLIEKEDENGKYIGCSNPKCKFIKKEN